MYVDLVYQMFLHPLIYLLSCRVLELLSSLSYFAAATTQEVMLEFRAGRMFTEGTQVVPDTRKGLVRIGRVGLNLMKFMSLTIFSVNKFVSLRVFCKFSLVIYVPNFIIFGV